ncbi:MAG TPA: hypothetical protein VGH80_09535 [Xanthomonadaceae bacterium]|jgi:predicted Zn-dependent protease
MSVDSDHATLWQQACEHFAAQRHADAEACCRRLIVIAPERPLAWAMLARLSLLRGRPEEASRLAIEAGTRSAGAPWQEAIAAGIVLLDMGEKAIARELFSLVDPRDVTSHATLHELARCHDALGDAAGARHCLDLAQSLPHRSTTPRMPTHA